MAKLAFLTEVRDCKTYLPQAVESILAQTFADFDYYITDDGSRDGTRELIAAYAARDSRIIPCYCENDMHGNFNRTLERIYASDAAYFALLDADDWYEADFAEIMIALLERTDSDLAEASFTAHYADGSGEDELPGFGDGVLTLAEFAQQFVLYSFFDSVQQWWAKMYRVPLLRERKLLAGDGWDTEFVLRYRAACRRFAVCGRALHHYRIRQDSDCHKRLHAFDGVQAARALTLQHDARETLLNAAACRNPESRLMAAYQDVNGVKSNFMRLYAGDVPEETVAQQVLPLLRLPFLAPAYEAVEHAFQQTGRLFFAGPGDSSRAMESLRSHYGRFLRLVWRRQRQGNEALLFGWLCRVFPHLPSFFEPNDLPVLMDDRAIPVLERRWRAALAGLRHVAVTEDAAILRAFACTKTKPDDPFLAQFLTQRGETLSAGKRAILVCKTPRDLL